MQGQPGVLPRQGMPWARCLESCSLYLPSSTKPEPLGFPGQRYPCCCTEMSPPTTTLPRGTQGSVPVLIQGQAGKGGLTDPAQRSLLPLIGVMPKPGSGMEHPGQASVPWPPQRPGKPRNPP